MNTKMLKFIKFEGDMLIFCEFIQVLKIYIYIYIYITNHHLNFDGLTISQRPLAPDALLKWKSPFQLFFGHNMRI